MADRAKYGSEEWDASHFKEKICNAVADQDSWCNKFYIFVQKRIEKKGVIKKVSGMAYLASQLYTWRLMQYMPNQEELVTEASSLVINNCKLVDFVLWAG